MNVFLLQRDQMTTIRYECPHCRTSDIGLIVEAFSPIVFGDLRDEDNLVGHFSCPRCYMPSAAVLQNTSRQLSLTSLWNENYKGDPTTVGWEIFKFWPSAQPVPPPFS